jgi:hypothetical protein
MNVDKTVTMGISWNLDMNLRIGVIDTFVKEVDNLFTWDMNKFRRENQWSDQ